MTNIREQFVYGFSHNNEVTVIRYTIRSSAASEVPFDAVSLNRDDDGAAIAGGEPNLMSHNARNKAGKNSLQLHKGGLRYE